MEGLIELKNSFNKRKKMNESQIKKIKQHKIWSNDEIERKKLQHKCRGQNQKF